MYWHYASDNERCIWYAILFLWVRVWKAALADGFQGRLVGAFSSFYNPESGETPEMFLGTIDENV